MNREDFFILNKKVLEDFFSKDKIKKLSKNHPALKRWNLCDKLIKQGSAIKLPEDSENFLEIASMLLDNNFLLQTSGENVQKLFLGDFSNYGDDKVRRKIIAEVVDENKFLDVMTELTYAAWHISKNQKVIAYEEDGYPDFKIILENEKLPIVTECKCVHHNKNINRIEDVIRKAGKQIKNIKQDCYGLVVINIASKVNIKENIFVDISSVSDDLPPEVILIKNIAERSINLKNRAISGILLIWDDYSLIGNPEKDGKSLSILRKRSLLIKHKTPLFSLADNFFISTFGYTITQNITWTKRCGN
jgi:hypothetical protein